MILNNAGIRVCEMVTGLFEDSRIHRVIQNNVAGVTGFSLNPSLATYMRDKLADLD